MTMPYGANSQTAINPARRSRRTGNIAFDASLAATQAQADVAGEDFARDVGERLGGLNAIGALRSGGAATATREAPDTYSKRIGQASAGNAMQFAEMENRRREKEMQLANDARSSSVEAASQRERFEEDKRRFDLGYGLDRDRMSEDTRRFDQGFGEDRRRFDSSYGLDRERFGEDRRRFDVDTRYRDERAQRSDAESDRGFYEDTRRYDQGYGRDVFESDRNFTTGMGDRQEDRRRYEQERMDAKAAEKRAKKRSLWGTLGAAAGGFLAGGPLGAGAAVMAQRKG